MGFRSLSESIDTTTANGRLFFSIMGALAEFERDLIRERTHAGLAAARARGRVGGRPTVMNAKKIDKARKLYDSRQHTVADIAEMLNVSVATVYRHLGKSQDGLGGDVIIPVADFPVAHGNPCRGNRCHGLPRRWFRHSPKTRVHGAVIINRSPYMAT